MNNITVQLEPGNPYKSGSSVYLDVDGKHRTRVGFDIEDYARIRGRFRTEAAEFAYFTSVIYGCDRAIKRDTAGTDKWTRELTVRIAVADPRKWKKASHIAELLLEFLTGDIWHLDFAESSTPLFGQEFNTARRHFRKRTRAEGSVVSLFSGGLDSLVGVIDWLENNPSESIVLASTYDAQAESARADQDRLMRYLGPKYKGRIQRCVARTGLCSDGEDTNFRSRSLAFLGNAVLAASFLGVETPILIPENGAIALNYHLTPARAGSLSTRTVHPYFIHLFGRFLVALGFKHQISNPYQFKTKGQMLNGCLNKDLLKAAYAESVSCGKRGFDRKYWSNMHAHACGACVPCIFRRAALFKSGLAQEQYGYDLSNASSWRRNILHANSDLQAVIDFVKDNSSPIDVWRNLRGNSLLGESHRQDYLSLVQALRDEVSLWLTSVSLIQ